MLLLAVACHMYAPIAFFFSSHSSRKCCKSYPNHYMYGQYFLLLAVH